MKPLLLLYGLAIALISLPSFSEARVQRTFVRLGPVLESSSPIQFAKRAGIVQIHQRDLTLKLELKDMEKEGQPAHVEGNTLFLELAVFASNTEDAFDEACMTAEIPFDLVKGKALLTAEPLEEYGLAMEPEDRFEIKRLELRDPEGAAFATVGMPAGDRRAILVTALVGLPNVDGISVDRGGDIKLWKGPPTRFSVGFGLLTDEEGEPITLRGNHVEISLVLGDQRDTRIVRVPFDIEKGRPKFKRLAVDDPAQQDLASITKATALQIEQVDILGPSGDRWATWGMKRWP